MPTFPFQSSLRPMKRSLQLIFLVATLVPIICVAQVNPSERKPLSAENWRNLKPGDIVFIRSRSDNAPLIAALSNVDATADADDVFTHCGIVFKNKKGEWIVYEGAGRKPKQYFTLQGWRVEEAKKKGLHNVYVRRWKEQAALTPDVLGKIETEAKTEHTMGYDNGFSWTNKLSYCSELVWKAYHAGGLTLVDLPTMEAYVKAAPTPVQEKIIKKLEDEKGHSRKEGYIPSEPAISPETIFRSPSLISVTD